MEAWQEKDEWFNDWFEIFWLTYDGKKLCGSGQAKGPKSKARESAKKKIKSKEKAFEVLQSLREQIKFYLANKNSKEFIARFPMCVTFINQERWTVEIDSFTEEGKPSLDLKNCKHCSEPVHGPRFDVCAYHYTNTPEQKERVKSTLKELEMLPKDCDSKEEWIRKQLEFARKNIKSIGVT